MAVKATLQQIIAIVFQRMETFDQRVEEETAATLKEALEKNPPTAADANSADSPDATAATTQEETLVAQQSDSWYPDVARVLGLADKPETAVATANGRASTDKTDSRSSLDAGAAPAGRPAPLTSARGSTTRIFAPSFPSALHKDVFLLFRSLCRISMRSVAEDSALGSSSAGGGYLSSTSGPTSSVGTGNAATDDPFAFQSKITSLELVLSIINNAGPSFRKGERFIHAIRQYLCQSLLQNCTSNYTQIVGLSLQAFLMLLNNFKRHLKTEIDVFVTSISPRILQSENSSFDHKMLVLEVLNNICDDASILGEIFLNYDCDWNNSDLFKQIVDALAKIAKGKKDAAAQYASMSSSVRVKMQQNDAVLVLKGLECLTATVASLKKAANFVETEKKVSSQRINSGTNHSRSGDIDDNCATPSVVSLTAVALASASTMETTTTTR